MPKPQLLATIACNRFGLGARENEIQEAAHGEREWLIGQLSSPTFDGKLPNSIDAILLHGKIKEQRENKKQSELNKEGNEMMASPFKPKSVYNSLVADGLSRSVQSDNSFSWRLYNFFSNHFSVTATGTKLTLLGPTLEREAVAPNLFGQFEDMLIAVTQHPAMLLYLNNEQSFGPNSKIGKKRKNKGINENLAREILELHTLGVNGGYQQADVIELAKAISGWSTARKNKADEIKRGGFNFRPTGHEPGARTVLGKKYTEEGLEQGVKILRDLARHPATAKFISTKIARHFAGDIPPNSLIERLEKTWLKTEGNLKSVYTSLVNSPEVWLRSVSKYKTPIEFFVSAHRAFGKYDSTPQVTTSSLTRLGQRPLNAGSPAGFPDTGNAWDGADALYARIEWSALVAKRNRRKINARSIATTAFGDTLSDRTRLAINRAESQEQAIALFLMSPEFQRR